MQRKPKTEMQRFPTRFKQLLKEFAQLLEEKERESGINPWYEETHSTLQLLPEQVLAGITRNAEPAVEEIEESVVEIEQLADELEDEDTEAPQADNKLLGRINNETSLLGLAAIASEIGISEEDFRYYAMNFRANGTTDLDGIKAGLLRELARVADAQSD